MSRMCRMRATAVAVLAAGLAGSGATNALATDPPPPPSNSGIGQYVEQVPSSGGSKAPGVSKSKKTKLPKNVATKIRRSGGTDASLLEKVATSSDLGAPQQSGAKTKAKAKRPARDTAKPAKNPAVPKASRGADATRTPAVAAAADTGSGGGSSHTPLLVALAIVVASTVAFGAWYAVRRRSAGPP